MLVTADQLVAHAIGDYVLQSDWMATAKTQQSVAAAAHALVYTLVFLVFSPSWTALAFIAGTHFGIDRWRLARYVVWAKNWLAPWPFCPGCEGPLEDHVAHRVPPTPPWAECPATGYPPDRPVWLTTWLLIIADNTLHVLANAVALRWL
jgi:hypothetical protein